MLMKRRRPLEKNLEEHFEKSTPSTRSMMGTLWLHLIQCQLVAILVNCLS